MIVRDLWTQACPHVGTPPILVLSYKNHAIDEFLVDLVRAVPAVKMIRVGSQSTEPLLQRFMERTRVMSDVTVQSEYQKIQHIYSFRQILQSFSEDHSKLRLHRANILGEQPTDEQEKKALKHETYAAVQIFANVLHRISYLITQSESNGTLSDDEKKVKEIASGVQKSVMQAASSYGSLNKLKSGLAQIPSKMEASTLVISLAEGIKHYGIKDIHEILLRWMQGFVPRPPCPFDDCKRAALLGNKYCHKHSCCFVIDDKDNQCRKRVVVDKALCVDHACEEYDCLEAKLNEKQKFCHLHACVKCLEAGEIAGVAYDDPPRNTCEKHPLCQKVIKGQACDKLAVLGSFCDAHGLKCRATTAKGRPCMARPMSTENPYCKDHQPRAPARVAASTTTTSSGKCAAITKKGQPCKGTAISGMSYCRDHLSLQAKTVAIIEQPIFTKETAREEAASGEPTETETPTEEEVKEGEAEAEADAEKTPYNSFDDESDDGGVVDRDRNYTDNVDEIDMEDDESDYLQHLRDVGDVEEKEELCFHQDEVQPEIKDTSTPTTENATWVLPSLWSWKMSLDERWEIIFDTLELESKLSAVIDEVLLREFTITRRDYKTAKVKANARVYEGMEVIGGTIVGCVTRLEAIRGTNPFAILVEEASEVLEPLLFSCIVPSTVKLEMIGDHRQLQPSMMGKFDFERINKMNMSLFERLIRAPPQYAVPSSVLSVQRRMRPNICDLTRDFYFDITNIEDHSVCAVKKIKRVLPLSFSKKDLLTDTEGEGREVPGVLPHIYFWTHAGKQERASVGLSKENKQEADMVCKLAEYLVACGVPKTSIAVLTPYKGQLMLLRKLLMKQGILAGAKSSDPQNTCRVSTVDRFQGDEADVVIISLVIDANSKTPFVKLVNRMIVLLSRARIGMYIVGNVGYFEDQKSTAEHWRKVFLALKEPAASDTLQTEATCETFSGTRIGSALPICCPRHRNSVFSANTPNQLKLGFCTVRCQQTLPNCQHECGLACHWPTDSHNKKCSILVEVPCATHPEKVPCHELTRTTSLARALANYKCTKKVDVQMPCGHITTFPCHESVALASGAMPWPKCEHAAHLPFVLPGCKHETAVKCWQYALYTSSPSSIPPCQKKVDYYPACGHSVQVLCTTKQQYDLGKIVFMCKTMVDRELPRCSHTAQMPCVNATQLDSWTGQSCEEVGIVREGTSYGEKDHTCKKVVKFIRLCGHQETHPCERAFELAKNPTKCNVKEAIVNPICGHEGTILCHQKKLLSGLSRDGLSPVSVVDETNPGAGYLKPQGISIPCTHHVKLQRACGHVAMVECSKARGTKTACEVPKTIKSPLCGHDISAPCSLGKAIEEWQPWHEDFLKSLDGTSLMSEGIFSESSPKPEAAPSALIGRLPKCNQDLVFRRTCGHEVVMKCDKVFHSKSIASLGKCQDAVKKTMFCGHMRDFKCWQYQEYFKNPASMPCHEIVPKQCWNFECCSSIVSSPCITGFIQCDAESEWKCKQGHIFKFRQCKDGQPSACPDCILSKIDEELEKVTSEEYSIELKQDLPPILTGINGITVVPLPMTARDASEFRERVPFVLETYKKWCSEVQNPWDRPIFKRLTPLPCFTTFPQQRGNQQPKRPLSPATANVTTAGHAIRCSEWTKSNLQRFLSGMNSPSVTIAFGYGYSYKALINPSIPNNKKAKTKWIERLPDQAIDTIRMNNGDLIFLDPFLVSASHKITVTQEALKLLISRMPDGCVDLSSNHITFKIPDEAKSTISSFAPPGQATPTEALVGTLASGLAIVLNWDGLSFGTSACRLGEAIEKEMQKKVCYARSVFDTPVNDNPMGSINFLKKLLESGYFEVHLHLALECLQDEWDGAFNKLATESLGKYIREVKAKKALAHPLLLVAIARLEKNPIHVQNCLKSFTTYYSAATKWLTKKETMLLSDQPAVLPVQNQAPSPKELWEDLKAKEGRQSKAMEELLKLTGLKKVKESAIKMFKAALALMKLSPDARKKNMGSLNFAFLGNPGTGEYLFSLSLLLFVDILVFSLDLHFPRSLQETNFSGKTTVARLFAEILKDSGMRPKGTFIECTAQELKDEGPDKFRAKIAAAKDGVLFIDEAYDLDPFGDFKGKPIVAELLTAAENKRDELSIILAGYQDDMNEKFFKFNDGLKSRFAEVMFEDFEEPELREIWRHILSEKGFVADDKLGDIVSKRLARRANRKGFGNARDVRRVAEDAINTAMSRENFRGDNLEILMEDVVGECPANNPKINAILAELEGQIGWKKIKESIYEMVSLAQQNYERELQGTAPLPFPLHKMFLGNPGTGKTTCAKLYGRFLKAIGILSIGEVVCKTASDFVGQYVGQSSQKTNDILKAAQGKVLVIDEAYALNDQNYGKQVIDTLVEKVQGSHDDFAVLLLGYEKQMLEMIREQNPGLARRFPEQYAFYFEDYTPQELLKIFFSTCKRNHVSGSSEKVVEKVLQVLGRQRSLPNFGNAGTVNQIVENAAKKAAARQAAEGRIGAAIELEVSDIEGEDVEEKKDPLAPLDDLFNVDNIKKKLQQLQNGLKVAKMDGDATPDIGHFVFRGPPGTGKTTVARVMAEILFHMELLATKRCVETSGVNLTGEYLGQTKKKVTDKLGEAKGGVLFIDEAYKLGEGPYGEEALVTILEAMTSPDYKGLVIIIAGYEQDIEKMLARNAGLKSRFTQFFDFEDWTPADCVKFFMQQATKKCFVIDEDAAEILPKIFAKLIQAPGWANGRDVGQFLKKVEAHRADRVASSPTPDLVKTIVLSDVEKGIEEMMKIRDINAAPNSPPNWAIPQLQLQQQPQSQPLQQVQRQQQQYQQQQQVQQQQQQRQEQPEPKEEEAHHPEHKHYGRDAGVTDEQWEELEKAKKEHEAKLERLKKEKAETELREELKKQQALQDALRKIAKCPAGFEWFKVGGGWRCGGGSHFVTDAELASKFSYL